MTWVTRLLSRSDVMAIFVVRLSYINGDHARPGLPHFPAHQIIFKLMIILSPSTVIDSSLPYL